MLLKQELSCFRFRVLPASGGCNRRRVAGGPTLERIRRIGALAARTCVII